MISGLYFKHLACWAGLDYLESSSGLGALDGIFCGVVVGLTVIHTQDLGMCVGWWECGLAVLWGGGYAKGIWSHSSGAIRQAWWLLATQQSSLVFSWKWIPGFLGAGETQ